MSGRRREQLKSDLFRKRCKQLLDAGWSVSKITKQLGKSYDHTARICGQIAAERHPDKAGGRKCRFWEPDAD